MGRGGASPGRSGRPGRIAGPITIGIGILLIVACVALWAAVREPSDRLLERGRRAQATVVDRVVDHGLADDDGSGHVVLEFTAEGEAAPRRAELGVTNPRAYEDGQLIGIFYDRDDPTKVRTRGAAADSPGRETALTVVLALVGIAFVVGGIVLLRPFRPQPPPTPTYYGRDWSAPRPAVPYTGASWSSDRLRRAGWTLVGCGGALVAMLAPLATVMPQAPDLPSVRAEIVELDPAATGGGVSGDEMVADYAVPGEAVPRTVRVAVPDAYAYRVGDAIEVFYDPDDPSKVSGEPETPHSGWWAVAVAVVAVAIAAGTAGWLVLIRARSRAAAGA